MTFGHRDVGPYGRRVVEEDFGDVTVLHGVIRDGVARDGVTARGVSPQGIAAQGVSPQGVALQGVALQSGDARGGAAGRLAVVEDAERGRVLRVHYPAGRVGPEGGGAEFRVRLPGDDDLRCAYWVRFGEGFDFVRGGKLPGLAGGTAPTGGARATGTNGFSARMMWRAGGAVVQYLYSPEQTGVWGDDLPYDVPGAGGARRRFRAGRWHHVKHRVRLNTPGERDGVVQGWFDGELALDRRGLRFRDADTFTIDWLFFSTFFGGNEPDWAPTRDEHVDFDGFVVRATRASG